MRLDVIGDDESLEAIGPRPLATIQISMVNYFLFCLNRQTKISALDPALFAPAVLSRETRFGRHHTFGLVSPDIVEKFSATG